MVWLKVETDWKIGAVGSRVHILVRNWLFITSLSEIMGELLFVVFFLFFCNNCRLLLCITVLARVLE